MREFFRDLSVKHEALKKKIHSFRMPLGPRGRLLMTSFYIFSPVVAGYYLMQWTNTYAETNARKAIESLRDESRAREARVRGAIEGSGWEEGDQIDGSGRTSSR